jgi:uncharacterized iron-regulated membrane protein
MNEDTWKISTIVKLVVGIIILIVLIIIGFSFGGSVYNRYQARQDAQNQVLVNNQKLLVDINNENNLVAVNEIKIKQQAQLIQVEQQKADIRVVEAQGIAKAQGIINASLTDKYLQHEAIAAQAAMVNSPNHTTVYIPSGQNGIPLVKTVE